MAVLTTTPHSAAELLGIHEKLPGSVTVKPTPAAAKENKSAKVDSPKWRNPTFHIRAPHGWLNDPCGPGYDPSTGLYHVAFQWNPNGNDWGNISWGHSTSSDLVSWKTSPTPTLTPSTEYDHCGIFTGCLRATDLDGGSGSSSGAGSAAALTYIYTSVQHLPIHYTLPYVNGCESLSLAVSRDGGVSWERQSCNPILPGSPKNVKVTGWRDPYLTEWPSMDRNASVSASASANGTDVDAGVDAGSSRPLYGFLSGGIVGDTPTAFVYRVQPNDLRKWEYLGPLANVGLNFSPSRWSGDFGVNWEVANLMTLTDDGAVSRDFVIMGTEGCVKFDEVALGGDRVRALSKRTPRQQLWMSMKTKTNQSNGMFSSTTVDTHEPLAEYSFAGIFDHGCYYAANSFYDPKTAQHIVYGWITEEDLPDNLRHTQGWSGLISLPRAVKLTTLHNVVRARHSDLKSITSIETEPNSRGSYTIRTLRFHPDERVKKLRNKARHTTIKGSLSPTRNRHDIIPLTTSRWEVEAEFAVHQQCTRIGFEIGHNADFSNRTIISWESVLETFTIERPTPHETGINHGVETAPHTLFTFASDPNENEIESGGEKEETLRIRAIFDGSVLEVFVNDRTAISTRVYGFDDQEGFGVRFFAENDGNTPTIDSDSVMLNGERASSTLVKADIWDGLGV